MEDIDMADVRLTQLFTNIANAIRNKKGSNGIIKAADFPAEIESIEVGGGSEPTIELERKDVNFYDYEGTLLYAYTLDEAHALTELPPAPTHEGLAFQGWNWDLEDVVATDMRMDVGATYITNDGATRLYLEIYKEGAKKMNVALYSTSSVNYVIDWGDGTVESVKKQGYALQTHNYADFGKYVISIQADTYWSFGGPGVHYTALGPLVAPSNDRNDALKKIEIGNFIEKIQNNILQQLRIESITIPTGVTSIGNNTFSGCKDLRYVVLPKGTTSIGQNAFAYIMTLSSVSMPKDFNIASSSMTNNGVAYLSLPATMETLDNSALRDMRNLQYVEIPKGVSSVGTYCMYGLYSCAYIDFSRHESIPSLMASNAIGGVNTDTKIIVPDALYDNWKKETNWTTHAARIVKDSEYIRPL